MTQTDEILALHHQLDGVTSGLGYHELRVIVALANRIRMGQERYGELRIGDPRDWRREKRDEMLDWLIYDQIEEEMGNPPTTGEGG